MLPLVYIGLQAKGHLGLSKEHQFKKNYILDTDAFSNVFVM